MKCTGRTKFLTIAGDNLINRLSIKAMKLTASIATSLLAMTFVALPQVQAAPAQSPSASAPLSVGPVSVPVYYITNRQKSLDKKQPFYTIQRSDELHFGVRDVLLTPGPKYKYGEMTTVDIPEDTFFERLSNAQKLQPSKQIVVYVHGYDMNLDVSSKVAARMSSELQLPVVMFSWPSRRNILTYVADECMAEWASFQLSETLRDLSKRYGKENIILVGHSVGCRMICWSLQQSKAAGHDASVKYRHIFLCSPDIDAAVFKKYADLFPLCSEDTRVYASFRDYRLCLSKMLHGGIRLGMMDAAFKKKPTPHVDGIQTIDYTEDDPTLFGHAIPFNLLYQAIENDHPTAITHR